MPKTSEAIATMTVVKLKIRVMGKDQFVDIPGIEAAINYAVELISTGKAIPKGIYLEDIEVCSEQDINTYWEQCNVRKRQASN